VKQSRKPARKRNVAKIICCVVLILAALGSLLGVLGVKVIYDQQFGRFDRPEPATSAEMQHTELMERYPLELVNFPSGPNRLQGYLYHNPASPGLVVVVHGLGGGADSYLPQIIYFLDQGWSVFAYDATGCYDSEGTATRGFPQALMDLDAALRFVAGRPELQGLPVLLFGHSWGGYAVANILHLDHKVAGVVSIAGPNSSREIIMEQGSKMLGPVMSIMRPFIWLYEGLLFGRYASFTAVEALNRAAVPALIIHGTGDTTVDFNGSAIINKRQRIDSPQVQFLSLDEENRRGHSNILRSTAANAYVTKLNAELKALAEQYGGEIPLEVKREFFAQVDKALVHEVNLELMERIHTFFLRCLCLDYPEEIDW
jgi:pimeloyl-ACP methyl ester carboxylesterase